MNQEIYANIQIGGEIKTASHLERFCAAIAQQRVLYEGDASGRDTLHDREHVRLVLFKALLIREQPKFYDLTNGGEFPLIQRAATEAGLCWWRYHSAGAELGETETFMEPGENERDLYLHGGSYAVDLDCLIAATKAPDPLAAVNKIISEHSFDFPPFTLSPALRTHYAADLARVRITGETN